MLKNNFNRSDCIIALGGGVLGDLSAFISSLTNTQEGTSKWINNISHRGLSADGDATGLKNIFANVKSDGLKVNLWVDTDNKINLIEITGTITQDGKEFSILHISSE